MPLVEILQQYGIPIAATMAGLIFGFVTGAYIVKLWDQKKRSWQKKYGSATAAIAGMGGLPNAAFFSWIEELAILSLIAYLIPLLASSIFIYVNTNRYSLYQNWETPDPGSFEKF